MMMHTKVPVVAPSSAQSIDKGPQAEVATSSSWSFHVGPEPVPVTDGARLHRGVNNVQLVQDWMSLRSYCFLASSAVEHPMESTPTVPPHLAEVLILVAKVGPQQLVSAAAGVIAMTQNVRGGIFRMAGLRGVSSFPECRRKGRVAAVMGHALAVLHAHDVPFSTLYPFKASFYEKMGYVCVNSKRLVTCSPAIFASLRAPPALRLERMKASDFDKKEYSLLMARLQKKVHGFARFADATLERHMDWTEKVIPHWVVTVYDHKGIAGVMGYRTGPFMSGSMDVDVFAYANSAVRTALLSWIGLHTDQFKQVSLILSPDEDFEHLVTDAAFHIQSLELLKPQMARVVNVEALAGLPVGGDDAVRLEFTLLDPFFAANNRQRYRFSSAKGRLSVERLAEPPVVAVEGHQQACEAAVVVEDEDDDGAEREVQLDVRGLTGLVFGVVKDGARELETRGWGSFRDNRDARRAVKALFPPTTKPVLFEAF